MKHPVVRTAAIIITIIGVVAILFYARALLVPLAFGAVFAILADPFYEKLKDWGVNRYVALLASILLIIISLATVVGLLGWQVAQVSNEWPQIEENLSNRIDHVQQYIDDQFNISPQEQEKRLKDSLSTLRSRAVGMVSSLFGLTGTLLLVLVYAFILLLEKERFRKFVLQYTKSGSKGDSKEVMNEVSEVSRQYMIGKIFVIIILSVFYAIGFLIGGVKYAILLAIIAGVLSIIPYIGNIIGGGIAVMMALVTGGGMTGALIVLGVMSIAQVLESYVLTPMVIGDRVGLNAFGTIFGVIAFTLLWGVPGAILAIPLVAIAKSVFDHVEQLQPLGYLLGSDKEEN